MTKIEVERYNKTETPCSNCVNMDREFTKWAEQSEDEIVVHTFSAEQHRDALIELGASSAPVYVVKRDNLTSVVSGNNPDTLIDILEGDNDIWESDCSL